MTVVVVDVVFVVIDVVFVVVDVVFVVTRTSVSSSQLLKHPATLPDEPEAPLALGVQVRNPVSRGR